MSTYYPPYKSSSNSIKVELDLANYATKDDVKNITHVDVSSFASKTNLAALIIDISSIIDTVDRKITDISGLATKTSLTSYLQTVTFISKVTEVENKTKAKSADTKVNTIRSDLTGYAKKADVATDITAIKNDYITNTSLTSQLNNLKSQHIATEVTGIDNKTKKNASDILALENKLQQKEDTINENERRLSIFRVFSFIFNKIIYSMSVK